MNTPRKFPGLELAVIGFCAWQASDLLTTWRTSPFDRWGWLSFVIWLIPVLRALVGGGMGTNGSVPLTVAALALGFLGRGVELNAVLNLSLALACATLIPPSPRRLLWLIGSLAWMPLLGWLASSVPPLLLASVRVFGAAAAASILLPTRRPRPA